MTTTVHERFTMMGIGTAVPPFGVDQCDAAAFAARLICSENGSAQLLEALYRRSGVRHRYTAVLDEDATSNVESTGALPQDSAAESLEARQRLFARAEDEADEGPTTSQRMALYRRKAGPLATEASRRALENAGVAPGEVTHLVTVSCTGFAAPGVDLDLIGQLALPRTTQRTHVGFMGCHGAINGVRVGAALAESDPAATVLLCAVELCSIHHQYGWHPQRIVANSLFADGAAALVGRRMPAAPGRARQLVATGSCILERSGEMMTWDVGDHGFIMGLSPEVPQVVSRHLRTWLESWLGSQRMSLEDIGSWVIHPGGPRVVQTVAESLELPRSATEPSLQVLEQFGNMSSPTVLFILEQLELRSAPRPTLMLAFGPGLAIEAALWS